MTKEHLQTLKYWRKFTLLETPALPRNAKPINGAVPNQAMAFFIGISLSASFQRYAEYRLGGARQTNPASERRLAYLCYLEVDRHGRIKPDTPMVHPLVSHYHSWSARGIRFRSEEETKAIQQQFEQLITPGHRITMDALEQVAQLLSNSLAMEVVTAPMIYYLPLKKNTILFPQHRLRLGGLNAIQQLIDSPIGISPNMRRYMQRFTDPSIVPNYVSRHMASSDKPAVKWPDRHPQTNSASQLTQYILDGLRTQHHRLYCLPEVESVFKQQLVQSLVAAETYPLEQLHSFDPLSDPLDAPIPGILIVGNRPVLKHYHRYLTDPTYVDSTYSTPGYFSPVAHQLQTSLPWGLLSATSGPGRPFASLWQNAQSDEGPLQTFLKHLALQPHHLREQQYETAQKKINMHKAQVFRLHTLVKKSNDLVHRYPDWSSYVALRNYVIEQKDEFLIQTVDDYPPNHIKFDWLELYRLKELMVDLQWLEKPQSHLQNELGFTPLEPVPTVTFDNLPTLSNYLQAELTRQCHQLFFTALRVREAYITLHAQQFIARLPLFYSGSAGTINPTADEQLAIRLAFSVTPAMCLTIEEALHFLPPSYQPTLIVVDNPGTLAPAELAGLLQRSRKAVILDHSLENPYRFDVSDFLKNKLSPIATP